MFEMFLDFLVDGAAAVPPEKVLQNLLVAAALSVVIYAVYYVTYSGVVYNRRFNISLVMMTLITTMIMSIIANSVAMSLGMVGALSIVRFRTAVKDPRDTAYIFWAIATGIGASSNSYHIVCIGVAAVSVIALLLNFGVKGEDKYLVIVRGELRAMAEVRASLFKAYRAGKLRAETVTNTYAEIVYQIKLKKDSDAAQYEKIRDIEGVDYVNMVSQNGETLG